MREPVDLKAAINAVSDVVQNRPRPIRNFDQIYMKSGDMVVQSEIIADWADKKRLAFIGDGDAISVCVAYLQAKNVFGFGPSQITVFDFDERQVSAVLRFADAMRLENLTAQLYNCLDPFPDHKKFDCFYTNPPWGASNGGASVNVFVERGMEAINGVGDGVVVIADDDTLSWPKIVLSNVQKFASSRYFYVSKMQRKLHEYHLDDAPELRSCNLFLSSLPDATPLTGPSLPTATDRLEHFYGASKAPTVRYVRARPRADYDMAPDEEYTLELLEERS
jgi:predicted methyltransferase